MTYLHQPIEAAGAGIVLCARAHVRYVSFRVRERCVKSTWLYSEIHKSTLSCNTASITYIYSHRYVFLFIFNVTYLYKYICNKVCLNNDPVRLTTTFDYVKCISNIASVLADMLIEIHK